MNQLLDLILFTRDGHLALLMVLTAVLLALGIGHELGQLRAARSPALVSPGAVVQIVTVAPEPDPAEVRAAAELAEQIEIAYLEPLTTPIAIVTPPLELAPMAVAPDAAMQALADDLDEALEDAARWRRRFEDAAAVVEAKERLRARYLRLLRVERARVRAVFGEVWMRPRKPTLTRLAHEVIDIGPAAHPTTARLIPIGLARELAATG